MHSLADYKTSPADMYDIRLGAICKKTSPGQLSHGSAKVEKRYELAVGAVLAEHKIAREKGHE